MQQILVILQNQEEESLGAGSNQTRGIFGGGGTPTFDVHIQLNISQLHQTGNAIDFGDLSAR